MKGTRFAGFADATGALGREAGVVTASLEALGGGGAATSVDDVAEGRAVGSVLVSAGAAAL